MKPKKNDRYYLIEKNGNLILYDSELNELIELDELLMLIWLLSDGNKTKEEMSKILKEEFEIENAEEVIEEALEILKENNLQGNPLI